MDEPLVSIVIPTRNSEKTLPLCLESIRRQTYRNIEVIVVDNFSADSTVEMAKSYGAKVIQVRGERTKAKNVGLRHAKGKYVLFIDSDMELTPTVVEDCVRLAESNPNIGSRIIPERSVGNNYWAKVRDFERSFYAGTPIESPRFFRRDLALKAGGFDVDIVFYEEATLPYKIEKMGYDVGARINSYILHHEEKFSLVKWLKKKYYYGKSAFIYKQRYHNYALKQIAPSYRLKIFLGKRRFYSRPTPALGIIILKSLEYISAGLDYFSEKVRVRKWLLQ
jgi:glycosyltransferase involved in cell wall biosynthesis